MWRTNFVRLAASSMVGERVRNASAFKTLVAREDLIGKPVGVAFTERVGGQPNQIAYHAFDAVPKDPAPSSNATRPTITIRKRR